MNNNRTMVEGKVLVVDDEASIRNVVKTYLEYHGLTVKDAPDGDAALGMLDHENFDVVLSDIMMPKMDGLTLAGEVQKIQPGVMVILMTGYASVNTAVDAIKKDVFDYILKPFQNMQIVLQSIKRAIERKHLIAERRALIDDLRGANEELGYHRNLLEKKIHEIDSELARRVKRLSILYDISRSMTSVTDLNVLLVTIMDKIASAMSNTVCILWLTEPEKSDLKNAIVTGLHYGGEVPDSFAVGEGEVGETVRSGYVRVFRDTVDIGDPVLRALCRTERVKSAVLVPIRYENERLGVIAVLARDDNVVSDDDVSLLAAVADQASITIKNAELFADMQRMFRETIEALATAIDSRDNYTGGHSNMVTRYACMIAEKMEFDEERMEIMRMAGILHDVGKIGITDVILNKPGRLTDEEMGVIKAHPVLGRFILESIEALKPVARIVYHHHERFDGKGYPDGIAGETIPLESRILQVADIFDAITSDRIYRKAMPLDKAIEIIRDGIGTSSDPEVVKVFLELYEEGRLSSMLE